VCDFSTDDRYRDAPGGPVRARWSTPVQGWREVDGRRLPSSASATWHLPDGPLTYAEFTFRPGDISYNVPPAMLRPGMAGRPAARCPGRVRVTGPGPCATGAPPRKNGR